MSLISLHCDNDTTMFRAYNKIYNNKSEHIRIRHEYVRDLIKDRVLTISYVRSMNNLVDPFTKPLFKELVFNISTRMGLKPF